VADPIVEQLRALRCPEGSSAQIDLDTQLPVCVKPDGSVVQPIQAEKPASRLTGPKIMAWSIGLSAAFVMAAIYVSTSRRRGY